MLILYIFIPFSPHLFVLYRLHHLMFQTQPYVVIGIILPYVVISLALLGFAPTHLICTGIGKYITHILHFFMLQGQQYIIYIMF